MREFEDIGLIHQVTRLVWSRVAPFDVLEYEDLLQEAKIQYCVALEKFDESKGYKFSTFATRVMRNRLNYVADVEIQKRTQETTVSGYEDQEGLDALLERQERENVYIDPQNVVQQVSSYQEALMKLKPLSRLILQMMVNPTEFMLQKIDENHSRQDAHYPMLNGIIQVLKNKGIEQSKLKAAKDEIMELANAEC